MAVGLIWLFLEGWLSPFSGSENEGGPVPIARVTPFPLTASPRAAPDDSPSSEQMHAWEPHSLLDIPRTGLNNSGNSISWCSNRTENNIHPHGNLYTVFIVALVLIVKR